MRKLTNKMKQNVLIKERNKQKIRKIKTMKTMKPSPHLMSNKFPEVDVRLWVGRKRRKTLTFIR